MVLKLQYVCNSQHKLYQPTAYVVYASTNKTQIVWMEMELLFLTHGGRA